jgi:glucoamylase
MAELYHRVATAVAAAGTVRRDPVSAEFFAQVGVDASTLSVDAAQRLRDAGDAMLRAVVRHSDHLELSEQFDSVTGYEKSVRNLTWSYAAFLSALRARSATPADLMGSARVG